MENHSVMCNQSTYNQLDPLARVGLPTMQGLVFIHVREILYCQGESSQTSIYLTNKRRYLVNRTLKQCENILDDYGFCRVHKSFIINLQYLRLYQRGEAKFVELYNGDRIDVTKGYYEHFISKVRRI